MSYFNIANAVPSPTHVKIQSDCPNCSKASSFDPVGINDIVTATHNFGIRRCPNPNCKAAVFFINGKTTGNFNFLLLYPSTKIAFSKEGIPESVLKSFEEAIVCHSVQCYMASAIMLRKTLEEICHDQNATGSNLFKRLENLSSIIVVPKELIEATHELRLLGNDAAHLDNQTYAEIGQEEIEISIEFTKEILKAVYQYQDLLGRLRAMKKTD
ncbi:DUF4145 domain-containing protein [Pedobacter panaciterrae]|uniref:DUF4145 domain-containing protein n=1 Tax=Pedobacter panaciterrae TaxID=363849 RepID=A0ABU8NS31_9SPHI